MIDKTKTIYMQKTYSKKGIVIDTTKGRYLTDIKSVEDLLNGKINLITLNYLNKDDHVTIKEE